MSEIDFYGLSRPAAVAAVLKHYGRPMKTMEIANILIESGKYLRSDKGDHHVAHAIARRMKSHGDIVKLGPALWSLKES